MKRILRTIKLYVSTLPELRYAYSESQVRVFPEGQRRLTKDQVIRSNGGKRGKA